MALIKHEIPILEHDTEQRAVIMPGHSDEVRKDLPKKLVFAFLLDEVDKYAAANGCEQVGRIKTVTKYFPVYITSHKGEDVALCQAPLGSAAAVAMLDDLIGRGVREVIAVGSCGALRDFAENEFLLPVRALRDEGASYHYLPPARWVSLDERATAAIERALDARGIRHERVDVWSTDGFFRETAEMVKYRMDEGCSVVDMECAGLAACALFRGVQFGQLLFTADSLADIEKHDARDWGASSFAPALLLALDAVVSF